ncbi:cobalamin biosynthesis protein CobW [Acidocella aquatica]|uniref:Cobalamin biosynthesis protein CobW n=1 Tax=Acidocella aquatica TaxID=1922313 RepID=A0ABQ6A176_9PROT|nr:cobalamin biosynthesis protein CobW [Acidocella aquatica]GLR65348.1 cobalamin biosynthesis protein CobW [Acidocella aquatica]
MNLQAAKIPTTIITGFLGAGKTTLVRHILENAGGRRLAVIVNEFGSRGVDGEILQNCGLENCPETDIVELANGCLCCTVADDFVPTIEALMDRPNPPEYILIETSGLALPKPLIKAFGWPSIRSRLTVDGVIAVVDGPAVAAGRFADDPEDVARQRAADSSLDHDNPLAEVYEDQIRAADLVVLNKTDLMDAETLKRVTGMIQDSLPRAVKLVTATDGKLDLDVLLGLAVAAEDDLAARPSHHDAEDGEHEHDDFESFVVRVPELNAPEGLLTRLAAAVAAHDVLRVKGFLAVRAKPLRLEIQGVGSRFRQNFTRAWALDEVRDGHLVVIGRSGMDRAGIEAMIAG